ncbi:MAG: isochorismatase family protein [Candidatus Devosia phytovorans]|uniref:Isochorismatase family protein n=1 Tax=Candidatus Devosia phytovorans TaxID=3121372 RepID=A0AAJ6B1F2_9HYPH|nr:isochorismatase family protein [Devosia sp.]WEK05289.1 MAG: isochorismatase family protein [Devosia sp.]
MAVWDAFLTEDDKKVMAARKPRTPHGPGNKVALLLIDMQTTAMGHDKPIYEQLDEYSGACGPHAWKSVPYQQKLLAAARAAGVPVIYSKHVFYDYTGLPASDPSNNFSHLNSKSEIPVEVAMQDGEYLVEKQTPSCFVMTNLPLILRNLGVDGLLVGGNSTSGCVRATCVDGEAHGYKMSVIEEAVFDRIELSHAAALFDMAFKICDVIDTEKALDIIGPAKAEAQAA